MFLCGFVPSYSQQATGLLFCPGAIVEPTAHAPRTIHAHEDSFAGLILIGTSHPKEAAYSLANASIPVAKIYATEDGLASPAEVEAFRGYLPEEAEMVEIKGGNHAQFGYYGTQLGDNAATIDREAQQAQTAVALLTFLTLKR